MMFRKSYIF